ncbi:MAG: sugar-binding domain-containing protein, partial [Deinococcota bacterium]
MAHTHPDTEDFNFDWRFQLAEAPKANDLKADDLNTDVSEDDVSKADISEADAPEVAQKTFNDSHWRQLRLPHDWSIEASYSADLEGATAYLPGGIGWYRKHFKLDKTDNEQIFLYFDGVYNHVTVWLNGHKLWYQPYGYTPFYVNISHYLEPDNVLAVQVDHSRYVDSRWYTGSGIYRDVTLVRKAAVFVPIWGVTVKTPKVSQD